MEVRFSAYNENHKKRYVRNISILGNGGEKKRERKEKKELLLRFADKKLQCTRNAAKNSRYCDLYREILFSVSVRLFVMRQASNK